MRTTAGDDFSTTSAYDVRIPSTTRGAGGGWGCVAAGAAPPSRPAQPETIDTDAINAIIINFLVFIKKCSKK
jgi:hypothetical protein